MHADTLCWQSVGDLRCRNLYSAPSGRRATPWIPACAPAVSDPVILPSGGLRRIDTPNSSSFWIGSEIQEYALSVVDLENQKIYRQCSHLPGIEHRFPGVQHYGQIEVRLVITAPGDAGLANPRGLSCRHAESGHRAGHHALGADYRFEADPRPSATSLSTSKQQSKAHRPD